MMKKLCVIYNTAPRYREAIFRAIDKEYDTDWYFGRTKTDIKEMDLSLLRSPHYYLNLGYKQKLFWKCVQHTLFKADCDIYLTLMESRAVSDYLFLLLKRCLFPRKRVYIWTHGWYGKESKIEAMLKRWQFKRVDGIFVYGNYARKLLIEQGIERSKIFVIHNSLHYDEQVALRKKMVDSDIYHSHFGNNWPTLIFIGRLTKVKQLDLLIDALQMLKERGEHYNLTLVGNGEERMALETQVRQLGLEERVWFYGACYDEEQNASLIYNADLCVAPGNVGLTAMHTMVFGTPVVSHDDFSWQMPEFEAIKQGETGDFFTRGNAESLTDTIQRWMLMHSGKRKQVREACYREIDTQWNPDYQMEVIRKNLK